MFTLFSPNPETCADQDITIAVADRILQNWGYDSHIWLKTPDPFTPPYPDGHLLLVGTFAIDYVWTGEIKPYIGGGAEIFDNNYPTPEALAAVGCTKWFSPPAHGVNYHSQAKGFYTPDHPPLIRRKKTEVRGVKGIAPIVGSLLLLSSLSIMGASSPAPGRRRRRKS